MSLNIETYAQLVEMMRNNQDPSFHSITIEEPFVSGLELKIRKEVLAAVDELIKDEEPDTHYLDLLNKIKNHLNLLWGEEDE